MMTVELRSFIFTKDEDQEAVLAEVHTVHVPLFPKRHVPPIVIDVDGCDITSTLTKEDSNA